MQRLGSYEFDNIARFFSKSIFFWKWAEKCKRGSKMDTNILQFIENK